MPVWKHEGHCFKSDRPAAKFMGRAVCINCGLVRLRTLLTDWAVAKGCNYDEHPGWLAAKRTLPAQHRKERE